MQQTIGRRKDRKPLASVRVWPPDQLVEGEIQKKEIVEEILKEPYLTLCETLTWIAYGVVMPAYRYTANDTPERLGLTQNDFDSQMIEAKTALLYALKGEDIVACGVESWRAPVTAISNLFFLKPVTFHASKDRIEQSDEIVGGFRLKSGLTSWDGVQLKTCDVLELWAPEAIRAPVPVLGRPDSVNSLRDRITELYRCALPHRGKPTRAIVRALLPRSHITEIQGFGESALRKILDGRYKPAQKACMPSFESWATGQNKRSTKKK